MMSWAKLDDQYPDHPKIVEVGPLGMALHTAAMCYCARYLTDGFVPTAMIGRLINWEGICVISNGVSNGVTNKMVTDELTRVGLFEVVEGGFKVHDYLDYNPPAEQVKKERAENAARQAAWKAAHPKKQHGNGVSNDVNNDVPSPSPSPEESKNTAFAQFLNRVQLSIKLPVTSVDEVNELQAIQEKYPFIFWNVLDWIASTNPNSFTKVVKMAGTAVVHWNTKPGDRSNGNVTKKQTKRIVLDANNKPFIEDIPIEEQTE